MPVFWMVMGIISAINLLVLLIFFLPVIVFLVTDCLMDKNLGNKAEKRFPKIYRIWDRTLMGSLTLLLFTFAPFAVYCETQKSKEEKKEEIEKKEGEEEKKKEETK